MRATARGAFLQASRLRALSAAVTVVHAVGMTTVRIAKTLALLGVLTAGPAGELASDSYRCGRKLIRSGDPAAHVLARCGPPKYQDRGRETVYLEGRRQELAVERWYYQKSPRSLQRVILLHRGKVVSIEIGDR